MSDLLFVFSFIGTVAFAISGTAVAIKHKMDLFGVIVLGMITATGGGIIRDLVLGVIPPKIFTEPIWAITAVVTSLLSFVVAYFAYDKIFNKHIKLEENLLFISDAIGLAAFTVIGIESAMLLGFGSMTLLIFVGMITGVGGGMLRDVFSGEIPYVFKKHIYAVASCVGAITNILLTRYVSAEIGMIVGFIVVVVIRCLAKHFEWNLPVVSKKEK